MRKPRTPEILSGRVGSDGSIVAGDGFIVQKVGTGVYNIWCEHGFTPKVAVANPNVGASAFVACTDYIGNRFAVRTFVWNTAATAGDCPFNFIVTGA